jgi:anti-sigma factor RsiW
MTDIRHVDELEAQSYLDGLMPEPERAAVDAHLAGCESCQALVFSFESLEAALADLPLAEPPPDFTAGVMARIDEREAALAGERRVVVAVLAVVSVAIAVALALAGQAAWAPALSAVSSVGVSLLQGLRIASDVVAPLVEALRLQIILACAAVGIPLLLAVSRLSAPRQGQAA